METETRTKFAMAAMDFATIFNSYFTEGVHGGFKVQLTTPEGLSTGGGVQSVQHITLVNASAGTTMVVGSVNRINNSTELRNYETVARMFEQRFQGKSFPLDQAQFEELHNKFVIFFSSQSFQVSDAKPPAPRPTAPKGTTLKEAPKASATAQPAAVAEPTSGSGVWIAVAVGVALAVLGTVYILFLK